MSHLCLITVPIGNINDITFNAKEALVKGNYFAVEDTRAFKNLLSFLGIPLDKKKIFSFHDHSGPHKLEKLLDIINQGHNLYLVSEAGSPIISDPAYPLVKMAIENNISISNRSGISAVVTALELSGLPPCPFHFHGFLPREKAKINLYLEEIKEVGGTHIFFESPHRLDKNLQLICEKFPLSEMCLCRELTKKFESVYRFFGEEYQNVRDEIMIKGEFVLLINIIPRTDQDWDSSEIRKKAREVLNNGGKVKSMAKLLSSILGENSKEIYDKLSKNRR